MITTLVYDEDTGFLYTGDRYGYLCKYKMDIISKVCQRVRNYGNIGIDGIYSSHRFLHFIFFGGNFGRIRVLDLSTGELLPGRLETAIKCIYSLQVCVKSHKEIYLAVFGGLPEYSGDKTDLFDMSELFLKNPFSLRKLYSKYTIDQIDTSLEQKTTFKSQAERTPNLLKKRDSYKVKFTGMDSEYEDLKDS